MREDMLLTSWLVDFERLVIERLMSLKLRTVNLARSFVIPRSHSQDKRNRELTLRSVTTYCNLCEISDEIPRFIVTDRGITELKQLRIYDVLSLVSLSRLYTYIAAQFCHLNWLRSKPHNTRLVVFTTAKLAWKSETIKYLVFTPNSEKTDSNYQIRSYYTGDSAVCDQANLQKECFKDNNGIFVSSLCTDGMLIIVLL